MSDVITIPSALIDLALFSNSDLPHVISTPPSSQLVSLVDKFVDGVLSSRDAGIAEQAEARKLKFKVRRSVFSGGSSAFSPCASPSPLFAVASRRSPIVPKSPLVVGKTFNPVETHSSPSKAVSTLVVYPPGKPIQSPLTPLSPITPIWSRRTTPPDFKEVLERQYKQTRPSPSPSLSPVSTPIEAVVSDPKVLVDDTKVNSAATSRSSHDSDEGTSKTHVDVHFDDQLLTQMLPEDFLLDLKEDGEVFKWLADFAQPTNNQLPVLNHSKPQVTPLLPPFPPLPPIPQKRRLTCHTTPFWPVQIPSIPLPTVVVSDWDALNSYSPPALNSDDAVESVPRSSITPDDNLDDVPPPVPPKDVESVPLSVRTPNDTIDDVAPPVPPKDVIYRRPNNEPQRFSTFRRTSAWGAQATRHVTKPVRPAARPPPLNVRQLGSGHEIVTHIALPKVTTTTTIGHRRPPIRTAARRLANKQQVTNTFQVPRRCVGFHRHLILPAALGR